MKVVAISDMHGKLPEIPACDILLIAGDVCPVNDHSISAQAKFLSGPFSDWLAGAPSRATFGIAGNHDFLFQLQPIAIPSMRWTYLQDSGGEFEGLKIYGTPWQPYFYNWAFNAPRDSDGEAFLAERFSKIPKDIDILITHGPPAGFGDKNAEGHSCGSTSLANAVWAKRPRLTVFGHIHEGRGRWEPMAGMTLANVTILDEHYRMAYPPAVFEL